MAYITPDDVAVSDNRAQHVARGSKEPGTDYGTAYGTDLRMPADGTVITVDHSNAGAEGRRFAIVADNGEQIDFIHLSSINARVGQRVSKGQKGIVWSGASGFGRDWYYGPHVHVTRRARRGLPYSDTLDFEDALDSWNQTDRSTVEIQRLVGANPDGIPGPETFAKIGAWQSANRLVADQIWGELSDAVGFPITVDGDPGTKTYAKLQHRVGAGIDGKRGPETISRLQAALGVAVDGDPGPETFRALQTAVGANPDGEEGPETWRKTQAFLNTGKAFPKVGPITPAPSTPVPAPEPVAARTPVYPGALRGWDVPLASARAEGASIDWFIVHHQGSTNDDEAYFKRANERGSCPTWQVKTNGNVVEFIPPQMKPSSSGEANGRSVAVETQNTTMAPNWGISPESHEAIAQLVAWTFQQKTIGGVPVNLKLDRDHIFGDNEITAKTGLPMRATACPGPSMDIDRIVTRAREIVTSQPDTPPKPPTDTVPVDRSLLQSWFDKLKQLLGGGA